MENLDKHKMKPSGCEKMEQIKKYLGQQGRPLTISDLQNHFKDNITKKEMESSINSLVDSNDVIKKTSGKQNVYFHKSQDSSKIIQKIKDIDIDISKYMEKIEKKEKEIQELQALIETSNLDVFLEDIEREALVLRDSIGALEEEFAIFQTKNTAKTKIEPKQLQQLKRKYDNCLDEFHKRKRMCLRVVDTVAEGYPKTKKLLMEEMEIQTDEQANFNIKDLKI